MAEEISLEEYKKAYREIVSEGEKRDFFRTLTMHQKSGKQLIFQKCSMNMVGFQNRPSWHNKSIHTEKAKLRSFLPTLHFPGDASRSPK